MNRKSFITKCLLVFACFVIFLPILFGQTSSKENPQKKFKIVMVLWRGMTNAENGFEDYLKKRKIPYEFVIKNCNRNKSKLPKFIKEIRDLKPDLIYTFGTTVTKTVAGTINNLDSNKIITKTPIVFNIVADPIGAKIVPSLKSSQRNVTGTSHLVPYPVQIKAMKSMIQFKRLGIIFNPNETNSVLAVKALKKLAAGDDGFTLVESPIAVAKKKPAKKKEATAKKPDTNENKKQALMLKKYEKAQKVWDWSQKKWQPNSKKWQRAQKKWTAIENKWKSFKEQQLEKQKQIQAQEKKQKIEKNRQLIIDAVKKLAAQKPELIYIPSDSYLISNAKTLCPAISKAGIPSFSATEGPIRKAGALFGLVSRYKNVGKFAGYKAEQILLNKKNAKDLPIETLKRFSFLIHMDTARKLNFFPPISLFKFAEVISQESKQ